MVAQTCSIIGVYPRIHKQYRLLRCPITHRLASGILALRVHAKKEQLKAPLHGEAKRTLPGKGGTRLHNAMWLRRKQARDERSKANVRRGGKQHEQEEIKVGGETPWKPLN